MPEPLSLSTAVVIASLCMPGQGQTMYLDRNYYVDTKHTPYSKYSIRYAMHDPEREFIYQRPRAGLWGQPSVYRVRIKIPVELAKARGKPAMPFEINACVPVG